MLDQLLIENLAQNPRCAKSKHNRLLIYHISNFYCTLLYFLQVRKVVGMKKSPYHQAGKLDKRKNPNIELFGLVS
jgi:hypothetical protein